MVRQILFPTDFSNAANHAFPVALRMAAHFGAEITTVHAYIEPHIPQGYMTRTLQEIVESTGLEELEVYRDKLVPLHALAESLGFGGIPLRHALLAGREIVPLLLQAAAREAADLIIMGTTGSQGLEELFQGTIASEIVENAGCPVLLIPENIVLTPDLKRIAFATGIEGIDAAEATWLNRFAAHFGAEVVYINLPSVTETDFLAWAASQQIVSAVYCNCWSDEEALAQFLEGQQIELLALTTHKTSFFLELFQQNFGKHLARFLAYPLLGIPSLSE